MGEYKLNFNGYWIESRMTEIPKTSGIYLVYRCILKEQGVKLEELLYIGQTKNLYERLHSHEKMDDFKHECKEKEDLCFSVAEVPLEDLNIVENALIFVEKPRLNDDDKERFKFETPVTFHLEGRCALMKHQNFIIKSNGDDESERS